MAVLRVGDQLRKRGVIVRVADGLEIAGERVALIVGANKLSTSAGRSASMTSPCRSNEPQRRFTVLAEVTVAAAVMLPLLGLRSACLTRLRPRSLRLEV